MNDEKNINKKYKKFIKKPDFFIGGAARCATTSIYNYLKEHPEIFMCPVKEPNFFSKDIDTNKFVKGYKRVLNLNIKEYIKGKMDRIIHIAFVKEKSDYLKLFNNAKKEKAIGEASTLYLFSKVAAKEIYRFNKNSKIIIVLRNPIERTYSHYLMDYSNNITNKIFIEIINDYNPKLKKEWGTDSLCIEASLYYNQIKRYTDIFPRKNIHICFFEDLEKDPMNFIKKIYGFLGVDSNFSPNIEEKHNPSLIPRLKLVDEAAYLLGIKHFYNRFISTSIKKYIEKIYFKKPDNKSKVSELEEKKLKDLLCDDIKRTSLLLNKKFGIKDYMKNYI
jgi:hypothetical protein